MTTPAEAVVIDLVPRLRPADPHCLCGRQLVRCDGCGERRCLECDPYRSEDCSG